LRPRKQAAQAILHVLQLGAQSALIRAKARKAGGRARLARAQKPLCVSGGFLLLLLEPSGAGGGGAGAGRLGLFALTAPVHVPERPLHRHAQLWG
jgi:hypothetical protein